MSGNYQDESQAAQEVQRVAAAIVNAAISQAGESQPSTAAYSDATSAVASATAESIVSNVIAAAEAQAAPAPPPAPAPQPAAPAATQPAAETKAIGAAQQPSTSTSAASAAPRPAGLPSLPPKAGLGGLPKLPPKPAAAAPAQAAATPAAASQEAAAEAATEAAPEKPAAAEKPALPKLPPKPAKGMGAGLPGLPARPTPAAATSAPPPTAPTPTPTQPPAPAAPTPAPPAPARPQLPRPGGGPALPSRPGAAPSLGARPGLGGAPALASRPGLRPVPATAAAALQQPPVEVVDPDEPRNLQRLRRQLQDMRVNLLRVAMRLGIRYESETVQNFLSVLDRIERMSKPMSKRRADMGKLAERMAAERERAEAPDCRLGLKVKLMVVGMAGTGKSAFINAMLGRGAARTSAFSDATRSVKLISSRVHGVDLQFIDTPGLQASSSSYQQNASTLKAIKAAYKWHKPNFVIYVDRLDAARAGLGDMGVLQQLHETLGPQGFMQMFIVLTHANTARMALGPQYDTFTKQRKNILQQIIRQAGNNAQARNNMVVVDSHPECPTNALGQQYVIDNNQQMPWKESLTFSLVGLSLFGKAQEITRDKKAAGAAGRQQDLFKQLFRGRMPPNSYFVEQLTEGVLRSHGYPVAEDAFEQAASDEEAEDFEHVYYGLLRQAAAEGDGWAQKEYHLMLKRQERTREAYKASYKEQELETLATNGYEGMVAPPLDLGITFDPEHIRSHRYSYAVEESSWHIMPTLDYYGLEHEDAISGIVAERDGVLLHRDGWGGLPFDLTLCVEKDKSSMCLQGESNVTVVHSVRPFGPRHISQVTASFETLRPQLKDVLYTLEVNTFRDGLLQAKDRAGCGALVARLGEGGKVNKGPVTYGVRLQDKLRLGPFSVEANAAKVVSQAQMGGGREEAWGARAFVHYDWLPGVGMIFDLYQERSKSEDILNLGKAVHVSYDTELFSHAVSLKADYLASQQVMHVDVNVFKAGSYQVCWLLLLPLVNYLKDLAARFRAGPEEEEEVVEEDEEEEEEEEEDYEL